MQGTNTWGEIGIALVVGLIAGALLGFLSKMMGWSLNRYVSGAIVGGIIGLTLVILKSRRNRPQ